MKPSSGSISIAASAQKLDVDQRIALRYYYRIANNLLKQADIYRMEKNIIDLYVMLLRFSSLITETIPQHRDYHISLQRERIAYRKKLSSVLGELEVLKPDVQRQLQELNKKARNQLNRFDQAYQRVPGDNSLEWPAVNKQTLQNNAFSQARGMVAQNRFSPAPLVQRDKISQSWTSERKFSLSFPRPKEETLSRHSILGPNGLHGQWQPPIVSRGIQYPSSLDLTPVEIPSLEALDQPRHDVSVPLKDNAASEHEKSTLEAVLSLHDNGSFPCVEETCSVIAPDVASAPTMVDIVREPSPPPVLAEVQDLVPVTSQVPNMSLQDNLVQSESPLEVHISTTMMDSFMKLAKSNTDRNLETCGVLAGLLKNRKFYITALIIPKQESTSDSCQTTNEEEIFDYQDKQSLFPLGWIHTHPTQSCFMSSIDVHTHYSYQIMLPESIAIVMAPKDVSRKHGIFRLTAPGGMSVIRQCQQRGFHPHPEPAGGGPIYDHCTDVYMNPNLKFDVADLR